MILKYKHFSHLSQYGIQPFLFSQLYSTCSSIQEPWPQQGCQQQVYADEWGQRYIISVYPNDQLQQIQAFDFMHKRQILINYKGALLHIKESSYYVFASANQHSSLCACMQTYEALSKVPDEKFCAKLVESIISHLLDLQGLGYHLRIIDPHMIGLKKLATNEHNNRIGRLDFGLLMPFPCHSLTVITYKEYQRNLVYCAPEIISHFQFSAKEQSRRGQEGQQDQCLEKEFRKTSLYSLGLVILSCFGHAFSPDFRIDAARNNKEFQNFNRKIRREIKAEHNGKYISKVLKLLMEDCEQSRDTLETLCIKLQSLQFSSLKAMEDCQPKEIKITTILTHSDHETGRQSQTVDIGVGLGGNSPNLVAETSSPSPATKLRISNKRVNQNQECTNRECSMIRESPIDIQVLSEGEEDRDTVGQYPTRLQAIKTSSKLNAANRQSKEEVEETEDIISYDARNELTVAEDIQYETIERMGSANFFHSHDNESDIQMSLQNFENFPRMQWSSRDEEDSSKLQIERERSKATLSGEKACVLVFWISSWVVYGLVGFVREQRAQ